MNRWTQTLVQAVLVGLVVAAAGCTGGGPDGDAGGDDRGETPAASTIQQEAVAAMQAVETGQYSVEITETVDDRTETVVRVDGVVDRPSRRMRIDVTNPDTEPQTLSVIVDGDTVYTGIGGLWSVQEGSEQVDWDARLGQFSTQREVLANAEVEVTGTDEVDGREVWVLSVRPTVEDFDASSGAPGADGLYRAVDLANAEITQYVDTETSHVLRSVARIRASESDQERSLVMTTTASNIDEPVTVEVPAEAKNASGAAAESGSGGSAGGRTVGT